MALLALMATTVVAIDNHVPKRKRAIGIFNVVKFPNDACNSNSASMNGTCYTAEECASRDGTASGECAEGYGVCCVLTVACGASTTENSTYLSQDASANPATDSDTSRSCTYTICPQTTSVTRIRLDLTTFVIAAPYQTGLTGNPGTAQDDAANAIGHCVNDQFSVTGAPVICGTNTGQHMIVDTDGAKCVTATFSYGLVASTSRSYTIKVTQFESSNEMGGPTGCLQFFTGETGTVSTFNWIDPATSTHLANQNYDVCVRALIDKCSICWTPTTVGTIAIRGSFGVSNAGSAAGATMAKSGRSASCPVAAAAEATDSDDFVLIPNGMAAVIAGNVGHDKYCGRYLNPADAQMTDAAVCTSAFTLGVSFDGFEANGGTGVTGGAEMANMQEASGDVTAGVGVNPLGTQGFQLAFAQADC